MAFAAPAAIVPPTSVQKTSFSGGTPRAARNMAGTVVTSSSSMMRGLVSATYAETRSRTVGVVEAVVEAAVSRASVGGGGSITGTLLPNVRASKYETNTAAAASAQMSAP